jgi:hypothetical protein
VNASYADFVAVVRMIMEQQEPSGAIEGIIDGASYDPKKGTVTVLVGHTATLDGANDALNEQLKIQNVPLPTAQVGVQGGPIGLERCVLIRVRGGWRLSLEHGEDDSPGVAPGEYEIHLRDQDPNAVKHCAVKVQKDATRLGHTQKISALAPRVILGQDDAADSLGLVRKQDLQQAVDDMKNYVQNAFNQLAQTVQSGAGVPPPTVQHVTAQSSTTSFTK